MMIAHRVSSVLTIGAIADHLLIHSGITREFTVVSIKRFDEALSQLNHKQPVDVIVLELAAGSLNGLRRLKLSVANAAIVVIVESEHLGLVAVSAGADEYLCADHLTPELLQRTLRSALARRPRSPIQAAISCLTLDAERDRLHDLGFAIEAERYHTLFESVPVSLLEEDWSAVFSRIEALRQAGVKDCAQYLDDHPEYVDEALAQVKVLDINEATVTLFDARSKSELMHVLETPFLTAATRPHFINKLVAVFNKTQIFEDEMTLCTLSGEQIQTWVKVTFPADQHASGLVVVSVLDITAHKQALATLQQQATFLDNAERLGSMGSWIMDLRLNRLSWSEGTYRLFEVDPAVNVSLAFFLERVVPEDRETVLNVLDNSAKSDGTLKLEYRISLPNGEIRWLLERGTVEFDAKGEMIRRLGMVRDITAQKTAEAALRASEERFRHVFRDASIGIVSAALDGRFLEANTAYCTMLGYSEAELRQLDFMSVTHPDDQERNQVLLNNLLTGTLHRYSFEKRYLTKANTVVWCRLSVSAQRDSLGQPLSLIGIAEDITLQRESDLALTHSQGLLKVASHLSRLGAWWIDLATLTLSWSEEVFSIFGMPYGQAPSVSEAIQLFAPEDQSRLTRALGACITEGVGFDMQLQAITLQGERVWTRSICEPVRDEHGTIIRIQGAFQDISEQKLAVKKLRESEERFRLLSRATHDAIWDWDLVSDQMWWGYSIERIFGHKRDRLDQNLTFWQSHIHPDDFDRVLKSIEDVVQGDVPDDRWECQYRFQRSDDSYAIVLDKGYVIRDAEGNPVRMVGGMSDISEKIALEARWLQSQRLESVGQLTGGIAHDFNNLLTVIMGNSELLTEALEPQPQLQRLAAMIGKAASKGADLIQRLLAFARRQSLDPKPVNVNQLIANLDEMLRRIVGDTIELNCIYGESQGLISVDVSQLESAILNLGINARDAMPDGGVLTIETTHIQVDANFMHRDIKPGSYLAIAVTDTGHGMTPEVLKQVFEPFFTTKTEGKGTGLGLSMVYGFVRQSNGYIKLYSEPGLGTTVSIYLPCCVDTPQTPTSEPKRNLTCAEAQELILLVEDNKLVCNYAQQQLETLGHRVLVAHDGPAALAIIAVQPDITLLFTDVMMPGGLNGYEVAAAARQYLPRLKVLYTSGYSENALFRQGRLEAGVFLLNKPYSRAELAHKVRQVLAEG